jgi:MHS family proline/betaine transporter-like MFS transporter
MSLSIAVPTAMRTKAIVLGALGNVLEYYDFSIYGFLVPSLGAAFFPNQSHIARLLFTFGVFGVGFLARPVGAVVIGAYGDKVGRRAALILTISLMGISTLLIGVLPTYAKIGIWAPVLLTVARLGQGFSTGGQWGGAAAFLVEYAPEGRRGYVGSWVNASIATGLLLGSTFAGLLAAGLGSEALAAWGWRIPFLFGVTIVGLAVYFSLGLRDTPQFESIKQQHAISANPLRDLVSGHLGALVTQFGLTIFNTASFFFTLYYMPTWLTSVAKVMPQDQALEVNSIGLAFMVCVTPFIGILSDRIGRKPVLMASCAGFILLCYPLLKLVTVEGTFGVVLAVQIVLVLFTAGFSACSPAAYVELFPTRVRYSGLSVGYNLAVTVFGGFAPFIATLLVFATGNNLSAAFYVIACAAVTSIFAVKMRETAFAPLQN